MGRSRVPSDCDARGAAQHNRLRRTNGIMFIHADLYGAPDTLGALSSCLHDPVGRQVQPCAQGFSLGLDGESISRIQDWQVANGPGLDDPLVGLFRQSGVTKELYYVTDGQGRRAGRPSGRTGSRRPRRRGSRSTGTGSTIRRRGAGPRRTRWGWRAGSTSTSSTGMIRA
jgi:hypothetical protein